MGKIYDFKTSGGAELIPVADDDFYTDVMDTGGYDEGECFLQFYDSDGTTPITPSGGTIIFRSGAFSSQFLRDSDSITINAVDVIAGDAVYSPPSFDSAVRQSKMTLSGITGASYVKAFHWRHK